MLMNKDVVLTGLRANNDLHIGNYFGAMLPIIEIATQKSEDFQINMFIPDLHSFTTPVDHSTLQTNIVSNARYYAAAGLPLDDNHVLIYRQSFVPAHSELTWILDCFTGMGEMERMTQYKDKASKQKSSDRISVGLFNYPVLMAADILLYDAKYVPVGDDQTQHLEFTRNIAERINNQFGNIFRVPESVDKQHEFFNRGQALRIKDLVDPTKKMSKSNESTKGVIFLTDEPKVAASKIMSATTDDMSRIAYNPIEQPGISNLLVILALLRGKPVESVEAEFINQSKYGEFKQVVASEMSAFLSDYQNKLSRVDEVMVVEAFERSEVMANRVASAKLLQLQKAIGLRPKI